jgi:putative ABC transport system permease protein
MSWIQGLSHRLRAIMRRSRVEDELDEELRDHAHRELQRQLRTGLPSVEAARQARFRIGNIEAAKDAVRDERGGRWIADAVDDIRIGVRGLRRNLGFASAVVLSLILGVCGTTSVFSVVHAVLLRPLPYRDAHQLYVVRVWWNTFSAALSPADFLALRETSRPVGPVAAFSYPDAGFTMLTASGPEVVEGAFVTAELPQVLGIAPTLGGGFSGNPDAYEALISHDLWIRRFNASPDVLGRGITLDGRSYAIVGVMPVGFDVPQFKQPNDVWIHARINPPRRRGPFFMQLVVRLDGGLDSGIAGQRLTELVVPVLRARYGVKNEWRYGLRSLQDTVVGDARGTLLIALGAVGLVLLISMLNVSNLLLARGTARARELAVRASLGAGRGRLARQFLTESALLGLVGGVLGLAAATAVMQQARDSAVEIVPRIEEVHLSTSIVLFALGVGIGASLLAGLVPVLRLPWRGLADTLREGGRTAGEARHQGRARRAFVAAEIALSLTVLAGAALLAKSLMRLETTNPGFNPAGLVSFRLSLPDVPSDRPRTGVFMADLGARLRAIPQVTDVAVASGLPPDRSQFLNSFTLEGETPDSRGTGLVAEHLVVDPGYFPTLSVPLLRGRNFMESDRDGAPRVALVNQTFVRRHFAGQDPIGKRFKTGDWNSTSPWTTVIGVVGDVPYGAGGVWNGVNQTVYSPYRQNLWWTSPYVVVKIAGDPSSIVSAARAAVLSIDPTLPLRDVATMQERVRSSTRVPRFRSVVSLALAGIALALAVTGIYGVMSYHVSQRRRETAIRRALGAGRTQVVRSVVGAGLRLAMVGIVLGTVGALAMTRSLRAILYQVADRDPAVLSSAALLLFVAAALSCAVPAVRAAQVDPMVILRDE